MIKRVLEEDVEKLKGSSCLSFVLWASPDTHDTPQL